MAQDLLDDIVALAEAMLTAAGEGEWGVLVALEARRAELLAALDLSGKEGTEAVHATKRIRRILELDRQAGELAQQHLHELAGLLNNTGNQKKLLAAYGGV
ncbi:flagellar protein FliT [Aromatoleum bremense]|uniref:Flagellar protein FliT n=1 Tax=Aromatoleum bremense TaxID=76115 RepID=A0ABX1NZJ0_9RHOO|nr:flagellar protein FliT [Aromatoleum bremense]NMG17464.1 hypothetical protein [Aromatoleum bremense]QTQ30854.1 Flagellar protein [Aromatoleum bremense]